MGWQVLPSCMIWTRTYTQPPNRATNQVRAGSMRRHRPLSACSGPPSSPRESRKRLLTRLLDAAHASKVISGPPSSHTYRITVPTAATLRGSGCEAGPEGRQRDAHSLLSSKRVALALWPGSCLGLIFCGSPPRLPLQLSVAARSPFKRFGPASHEGAQGSSLH